MTDEKPPDNKKAKTEHKKPDEKPETMSWPPWGYGAPPWAYAAAPPGAYGAPPVGPGAFPGGYSAPPHCASCRCFHPIGYPCAPPYPSGHQFAYYPMQQGPQVALGNYQYPPGYQGVWHGRQSLQAPPPAYYPSHYGHHQPQALPAPVDYGCSQPGPYIPPEQRHIEHNGNYFRYNKPEAILAAENQERMIRTGVYKPFPFAPREAKMDQEFECRNPSNQRIFMTYANIKNGFPDGEWRQTPTGQLIFYMNRYHGKMPEMDSDSE